jgi:hypothetical protein
MYAIWQPCSPLLSATLSEAGGGCFGLNIMSTPAGMLKAVGRANVAAKSRFAFSSWSRFYDLSFDSKCYFYDKH